MKQHLYVFLVSAGVGSALAVPSLADAAWTRNHWSNCEPNDTVITNYARTGNAGFGNLNNSAWGYLSCGFSDTSAFPKETAVKAHVHVIDHTASFSVTAMACVKYAGGNGGACGSYVQSGASYQGPHTLTILDTSAWSTYSSSYGFVQVNLPPATGSSFSSVLGYKTYDY